MLVSKVATTTSSSSYRGLLSSTLQKAIAGSFSASAISTNGAGASPANANANIIIVPSSSFSSKSKGQRGGNTSDGNSFRPRRRTPKNLQTIPQPKVRRQRLSMPHAAASMNSTSPTLTSNQSNSADGGVGGGGGGSKNDFYDDDATLESKYGFDAANTIRHLRRTKQKTGNIRHPSYITPDAETTMRLADYMTSDLGSTEDLVGERRALMDAWDENQKRDFLQGLEEFTKECEEFSFDDKPWYDDDDENDALIKKYGPDKGPGGEEGLEDPNQKAFGPWSETIVRVDRVQKVQRGGTMVRYRALVIGGNLNGCAGYGVAKANAPNEACLLASRRAKRNIFFVDRYLNTGLTSSLAGRHNSCKVTLRSVSPNRGLHGHPLILEILKYFGISDCTAKSHGNRNIYNVVYATFKALMTHESLEDMALKRGKRLITLERAKKLRI